MKGKTLAFLFLAALSLASYANSLRGEFVYDDKKFIPENQYIKSLKNTPLFFTSKYTISDSGHNIYRPLRTLSFALDYYFWGSDVRGYHLINTSLHALNGFLIYLLLRATLPMGGAAILPAAFFILHPVQTEPVTWISSRGDLLSAFFLLLALLFYIGHIKSSYPSGQKAKGDGLLSSKYCLMILFFALSILSKESAIVFPLMLILVDYHFWRADQNGPFFARPTCFKLAKRLLPALAVSAMYILARTAVLGEIAQREPWAGSHYKTMLTMTAIFLYYIKLLILPVVLRVVYRIDLIQSAADPRWVVSAAALALLLGGSIFSLRKGKSFFFATAWFFLALLPVSNLIPIKGLMSEHFLYLPLFSFSFLLGLALKKLARSRFATNSKPNMHNWPAAGFPLRAAAFSTISIMLLFFFILTINRNKAWQTEFLWWVDIAKKSPDFIAHNNIGNAYAKKQLHNKALAQFKLAMLYLIKEERGELGGEIAVGSSDLNRTIRSKASSKFKAMIHSNLGNRYTELGLNLRAVEEYRTAGLLDPELYQARFNLGGVYYKSGHFDKAIAQFKEIIPLWPANDKTYIFIANSLLRKGLSRKAQDEYLKAYTINPFSADIGKNLGIVFGQNGFADKAFFSLTLSLFLEPAQAELAHQRKALAGAWRKRWGGASP